MADETPQGKRSRLAIASMWLGIASCGWLLLLILLSRLGIDISDDSLLEKIIMVVTLLVSPLLGILAVLLGFIAWRNFTMEQAARGRKYAIIGIATGIATIMIIVSPLLLASPHTPSRRISCASHLKQIGLALRMYASDWNGRFPPGEGAMGLELLRSTKYIEGPRIYVCPNSGTVPAAEGEALTEEHVDYHYRGGLTETDSPEIPVAWDKDRNHEKFGNILFVDGHVSGFVGKNWQENLRER